MQFPIFRSLRTFLPANINQCERKLYIQMVMKIIYNRGILPCVFTDSIVETGEVNIPISMEVYAVNVHLTTPVGVTNVYRMKLVSPMWSIVILVGILNFQIFTVRRDLPHAHKLKLHDNWLFNSGCLVNYLSK